MSETRLKELREQLFQLERTIAPLEWDLGRNQINEYKKQTLEKLREDHRLLKAELDGIQA